MIFSATNLEGVIAIDLERQHDRRGYFETSSRLGAWLSTTHRTARPSTRDAEPYGACITRMLLTPRRRSSAACRARSTTSSSTCGPARRRICAGKASSSPLPTARLSTFRKALLRDSRRWPTRRSFIIGSRCPMPPTPPPGSDTTTHFSRWPEPVTVISERDASWPDLERYEERPQLRAVPVLAGNESNA